MSYDKIRLQELNEQYETDASFRAQCSGFKDAYVKAFIEAQALFDGGKGVLPKVNYVFEKVKSSFPEDVVEYFELEGRVPELK